jgi:hypothetical protein
VRSCSPSGCNTENIFVPNATCTPIVNGTYINLYSCSILSAGASPYNPNIYVLQNNISSSGDVCYGTPPFYCLTIPNNVVLDLNGYSITTDFYCNIGDVTSNAVIVNGDYVTIRNGYINALGSITRVSYGVAKGGGGTNMFNMENVHVYAEANHPYLSHSSFALYSVANVNITGSSFISQTYASQFQGSSATGIVTNSYFNGTQLDIVLGAGSHDFYIHACFDPLKLVNNGINNLLNRTCPAGGTCGDGTCQSAWGETNANCPQDCPVICGNYICESGETYQNCPADCPTSCSVGWKCFNTTHRCYQSSNCAWSSCSGCTYNCNPSTNLCYSSPACPPCPSGGYTQASYPDCTCSCGNVCILGYVNITQGCECKSTAIDTDNWKDDPAMMFSDIANGLMGLSGQIMIPLLVLTLALGFSAVIIFIGKRVTR